MLTKKDILSVSVVLYNTPVNHIESLFSSLSLIKQNIKVYAIDNSPNNYLSHHILKYKNTFYIHRPENPGYGAGHNIAILKAREENIGPYHLVLNADISFNSDILSPMISYMDSHLDVGQMMPKILYPDGSIQRLCKLCPTPFDIFIRRLSLGGILKKRQFRFELRASNYDIIMFVPFLSGCFMLLRHSALEDAGMFDERFFMYAEDIDLSRRIATKMSTIFFPSVSAIHEHGAASKSSWRMFFIHFFSIVKYFNKWGWFFDSERTQLNNKTIYFLNKNGIDI